MISQKLFTSYQTAINVSASAGKAAIVNLIADIQKLGREPTEQELTKAHFALCQRYGKTAGNVALNFYKTMRDEAGIADNYEPEVYERTLSELASQQAAKTALASNNVAQSIGNSVSQYVKQSAANYMTSWAKNDPAKPRCARIAKATACGFCRMLASLGFWYANEQTARNAQLHGNCSCVIVVEFSKDPALEGYSYKPFEEQYLAAKEKTGSTKRHNIISQMDKDAGRSHLSAAEKAERAQKRAEKAAANQIYNPR